MNTLYNEIDTYCCDWLSNLMDAGAITPGDIDERSIEDITPNELARYERVHFFAGIGVWDYALRSEGWPEDEPVRTGSGPRQPVTEASKGAGFGRSACSKSTGRWGGTAECACRDSGRYVGFGRPKPLTIFLAQ